MLLIFYFYRRNCLIVSCDSPCHLYPVCMWSKLWDGLVKNWINTDLNQLLLFDQLYKIKIPYSIVIINMYKKQKHSNYKYRLSYLKIWINWHWIAESLNQNVVNLPMQCVYIEQTTTSTFTQFSFRVIPTCRSIIPSYPIVSVHSM